MGSSAHAVWEFSWTHCPLGDADPAELPAVEGPFFLTGGLPVQVLGLLRTMALLFPRNRKLFLKA